LPGYWIVLTLLVGSLITVLVDLLHREVEDDITGTSSGGAATRPCGGPPRRPDRRTERPGAWSTRGRADFPPPSGAPHRRRLRCRSRKYVPRGRRGCTARGC